VLDRLERADRTAELNPHLRVLDRHLEHLLSPADHLVHDADRGLVEGLGQRCPALAGLAERPGRHARELEAGLLAGLVHRGEGCSAEAVGVAVDGEERDAVLTRRPRGARDHDDQPGGVAVEDEHLLAVETPGVAVRLRLHRDAIGIPLAVRLGERERGDGLTGGDPGEQRGPLLLAARVEDRVRGEHDRRVVGSAHEDPTHLLEHDPELDEAEALAAVGLGDVEALETQLLGHLLPHGFVEALGRLHEPTHLRLRRLRLQEAPHGVPKLFLLFREREVHLPLLNVAPAGARAPALR
jgi:hypothetical protein